jgi:RNA polymerase sigma-70 factor (ECF subfamily)
MTEKKLNKKHFSEKLSVLLADKVENLDSYMTTLFEQMQAAIENCPTISVDMDSFAIFLSDRIEDSAHLDRLLSGEYLGDLFLAWALSHKDPEAMSLFQTNYLPTIQKSLKNMRLSSAQLEDICQNLSKKLFVPSAKKPAKINQYSGHGKIQKWFCVVAFRLAQNLLRKHKKEILVDNNELLEQVIAFDNQEFQHFRQLYQKEFKEAFNQALESLSARERLVLRYHLIDRLNIDQIGIIFQSHRSTVARWLSRIRDTLYKKTKKDLMHNLKISDQEFESIIQLIQSQLNASFERILSE